MRTRVLLARTDVCLWVLTNVGMRDIQRRKVEQYGKWISIYKSFLNKFGVS